MLHRVCTDRFKVRPLVKQVRKLCGIKKGERVKGKVVSMWIGISLDEIIRVKPNQVQWIENKWPLINDVPMTRAGCLNWLKKKGYPLPPKSSCIGCPYHSDEAWRDLKLNHQDEWKDAVEADRLIRDSVESATKRLYLHGSRTPLDEVDFRNLEDMGQLNMFNNECEGMCGV